MDVQHKDAAITPTGAADDFPGTFEVILSAPTKDRDGDTLLPDEWKTPLPDHITFDSDHGMTVGTTVGSGVPRIDDKSGNLVVAGTYSSLQRAQDVRTLVNEGHIRTTSVAFMTEKSPQKDGKHTVVRELLNGAFVAVPSNREALVLSSKAGARNSSSDAERIQAIHDHAIALGANPVVPITPDPNVKPKPKALRVRKSIAGSLEATQDRVRDALNDAYAEGGQWVSLRATLPADGGGTCIFDVFGEGSDTDTYQQSYTDDGSVVTLTGDSKPVDITESVTPDPDASREDNLMTSVPAATSMPTAALRAAAGKDAATGKDAPQVADGEVQSRRARLYAGLAMNVLPKGTKL